MYPYNKRVIIQSRRTWLVCAILAATAVGGAAAAFHYHRLDLTLSHYDARGHLIVSRRIADSITPGWQQIGAVWLPLPHLLNSLPVQIDGFYRSGASAVAISLAAFVAASGALAWIVFELTESTAAAALAAGVFALNPNILYLQATPMTEPLLLGLTLVAVALLMNWCDRESGAALSRTSSTGPDPESQRPAIAGAHPSAHLVGSMFALACLTRYEAWPVTVCALLLAAWVVYRQDGGILAIARRIGPVAVYPVMAIAAFLLFSRVVVGEWFTASGFFVPENKALGKPVEALSEIAWGTRTLSSLPMMAVAGLGLGGLIVRALTRLRSTSHVIVASLVASAALPFMAFLDGHPFRIRYMVPLLAIEAIGVGVAVALVRRFALPTSLTVGLAFALFVRPFDQSAPMVLEAQWDRPNVHARRQVTDCLRSNFDGEKIMASMGSLGHYMQETSHDGFELSDFLHEGNGDIWLAAIEGPRRYAGWVLIEEKAEGGDMLAKLARSNPAFLDGFERMCEGAGLSLYRRAVQKQP
jgi:hypothetical protein